MPVLESVDAMAGPAGGDPAWPITHALQVGSLPEYHKAWSAAAPRSSEFTMPMDLAGVPAICLPSGFSSDGLPYSIQFSGQRLSEPTLCRLAHGYERRPSGTRVTRRWRRWAELRLVRRAPARGVRARLRLAQRGSPWPSVELSRRKDLNLRASVCSQRRHPNSYLEGNSPFPSLMRFAFVSRPP